MNNSNQHIDILIAKYLSDNISSDELNTLNQWINSSSENKKVAQSSQKVWDNSEVLITEEDIKKDRYKVISEIQKQQSVELKSNRKKLLIYKIAAILAIPVALALSWHLFQKSESISLDNSVCEISAPKGHVAKCILPDSSEVWLNTGSTISYNTSGFNQQVREIYLTGEAYFEVVKNKEKPFKVVTELADINVTGTSFNVKAYNESEGFEAVLAEGSINMEFYNQSQQKVILQPGERAVYLGNKKELLIEEVEPDLFTSWRKGEILFKDATLNDLVKELERIYDIKFHVKDPTLGEFRFRGMFSYNNNLIDALEKIKRTANINYYIVNKEVWLVKKETN